MRWRTKHSRRNTAWHRCFVWKPVLLTNTGDRAWMEAVDRRWVDEEAVRASRTLYKECWIYRCPVTHALENPPMDLDELKAEERRLWGEYSKASDRLRSIEKQAA